MINLKFNDNELYFLYRGIYACASGREFDGHICADAPDDIPTLTGLGLVQYAYDCVQNHRENTIKAFKVTAAGKAYINALVQLNTDTDKELIIKMFRLSIRSSGGVLDDLGLSQNEHYTIFIDKI